MSPTQSPTPDTNSPIYILMATYNGTKYLAEQIESIKAQTLRHWRLLVRDDASTDQTVALLKLLAKQDPRIQLMEDDAGNLGVARNFGHLMENALALRAQYFAFCDQDDVWMPDKLEQQFTRILQLEMTHSRLTPILVHSDLAIVSEDLTFIHPSFMSYQGIRNPATPDPTTVIFQNHIVGCTLLGNRALLEKASPVPPDAYMHDWWLGLFATFFGVIEFIPKSLVSYRQHENNQVGAGGIRQILRPKTWYRVASKLYRLLDCSFSQLQALLKRPICNAEQCQTMPRISSLHDLAQLPNFNTTKRITTLLKHGVHCQNNILTALLYIQIACLPLFRNNRKR